MTDKKEILFKKIGPSYVPCTIKGWGVLMFWCFIGASLLMSAELFIDNSSTKYLAQILIFLTIFICLLMFAKKRS